MIDFKVILCARASALYDAWAESFRGVDKVEVKQGNIFDFPAEAIVSPANSFGFMDGGIDWDYSERFGWSLSERLREIITSSYDGELLVGQAAILAIDDPVYKWLVSAPTMRVPMNIKGTVNAFLAFKAALLTYKRFHLRNISNGSLLCPGLGTGIGRLPPVVCARQMREAYDVVNRGDFSVASSLSDCDDYHQWLIDGY